MSTNSGAEALSGIARQARQHGRELAELLSAAPIADAEKAAWAALIPAMDVAALAQLEAVLKKAAQEFAAEAFEEAVVVIRAQEAKRQLEEVAITTNFVHEMDAIEAELQTAERSGGK